MAKEENDSKSKETAKDKAAPKKASGKSGVKKASSEDQGAHGEKAARSTEGHDHSHGAVHGHGGGHKVDRKEYWKIFVVLLVLTLLEVVVAQLPGIGKTALGIALVGMAVAKAACVGLYYMHLKHETPILKLTVAIPMATPAVYALVLILESAWRATR